MCRHVPKWSFRLATLGTVGVNFSVGQVDGPTDEDFAVVVFVMPGFRVAAVVGDVVDTDVRLDVVVVREVLLAVVDANAEPPA